eukprot:311395-Pelagomonas_calceolata.AAC.1
MDTYISPVARNDVRKAVKKGKLACRIASLGPGGRCPSSLAPPRRRHMAATAAAVQQPVDKAAYDSRCSSVLYVCSLIHGAMLLVIGLPPQAP